MNVGAAVRIGAISKADVVVGTTGLRSLLDDVVGRTSRALHVDLFRADDRDVVRRLASAVDDEIELSVLADADATTGRVARQLRDIASSWDDIGSDPFKQHGKSMTRDAGEEAVVATDLADADAGRRIEFAVRMEGAPSRALARVHAADGVEALAPAIDDAAREGIVINDHRTGATHATDAVRMLVAEDEGALRVLTKAFDDDELVDDLVAAAQRREVELVTHDLPKAQRRALEEAGVRVVRIDEQDAEDAGTALHGTMVLSGERAFVGSPYLESRVLFGSDGRRSREVAVVLDGDAAVQAARGYDEVLEANRDLVR